MIALQRMQPQPEPPRQRATAAERTRRATRERIARAQRRGYLGFARVAAAAALLILPLMLYVTLTANLTSMNYTLARVQAERASLLAQTMRQDDAIAKLESRERLAALAAQLGMHYPQSYAVVTLPPLAPAPVDEHGVALLGAVGRWFGSTVGGNAP